MDENAVHSSIRQLAAINVHHIVRRHWRSRGARHLRFLDEEEKGALRDGLLDVLVGSKSGIVVDRQVIKRFAVVAGDVARLDWMHGGWPQLLPAILRALESAAPRSAALLNVMLVLHYIVKELATVQIHAGRTRFAEAANDLLPAVLHIWHIHMSELRESLAPRLSQLAHALSEGSEVHSATGFLSELLPNMEIARYCFKVCRRLVPRGPRHFLSSEAAQHFWCGVVGDVEWLLSAHRSLPLDWDTFRPAEVLENLTTQHVRLLEETLEKQGLAARSMLLPALNCFAQQLEMDIAAAGAGYWAGGTGGGSGRAGRGLFEPLVLAALAFLTKALDHEEFQLESILREAASGPQSGPSDVLGGGGGGGSLAAAFGAPTVPQSHSTPRAGAVRIHTQHGDVEVGVREVEAVAGELDSFFQPDTVAHLTRLVVAYCQPLTAEEAELWESDPEAYVAEEQQQQQSAAHAVRPAAHRLLLELVARFPAVTRPTVMALLREAQGAVEATAAREPAPLFALDAVLQAVGVASFSLHDDLDFGEWLDRHLAPILSSVLGAEPLPLAQQVVLARALWVVSCWINDVPAEARPSLYEIMIAGIGGSAGDNAVRLAAATALKDLVCDFGFEPETFAPLYPDAAMALFTALAATSELSSRERLVEALTEITQAAGGDAVRRCAAQVLNPLPVLWEACAHQNVVRQQILTVLKEVAAAMGTGSAVLQEGLAPVIRHSLDINNPELVFLASAAVELWRVLVENAPEYNETLDALFPLLPEVLQHELDSVRTGMDVLSGYLLRGGLPFMERHSHAVGAMLARLVGSVKPESGLSVVRAMDLLVRLFPADGAALLEGAGALPPVLHAAADEHENERFRIACLSLLARVMVQAPGSLSRALGALESESGRGDGGGGAFLTTLMDYWIELFDRTAADALWTRKLWGMALLALLGCAHPPALAPERVDAVLNIVGEVVAQAESQRGRAAMELPGVHSGDGRGRGRRGSDDSDDSRGMPGLAFGAGSGGFGSSFPPGMRTGREEEEGEEEEDDDEALYGVGERTAAEEWRQQMACGVTAGHDTVLGEVQREAFRRDVAVTSDLREFASARISDCQRLIGADNFERAVAHVAESTLRQLRSPECSTPPR